MSAHALAQLTQVPPRRTTGWYRFLDRSSVRPVIRCEHSSASHLVPLGDRSAATSRFVSYFQDAAGARNLDLRITHNRYGKSAQPHQNGQLTHPHDLDAPLRIAAKSKIDDYREQYANNQNFSFLPAITSTSTRRHREFLRLLFLQAHRETTAHFTACISDRPVPNTTAVTPKNGSHTSLNNGKSHLATSGRGQRLCAVVGPARGGQTRTRVCGLGRGRQSALYSIENIPSLARGRQSVYL